MNKKLRNTLSIVYLILFIDFFSIASSISLNSLAKKKENSQVNSLARTVETSQEGKSQTAAKSFEWNDTGKMIASCAKAFTDALPPEFCWKQGGDEGRIPTLCPRGYFRSLALCYEHCQPGYRHVLGVCWADCPEDYFDFGIGCGKHIFNWFFKHSYIPHSMTNFDTRVPCFKGTFRIGALCYRNCNNIGMDNCGPWSCVSDESLCLNQILTMALDFLMGAIDLVKFIMSFGTLSTEKVSAKHKLISMVDKLGMKSMKKYSQSVRKSLENFGKTIRKRAEKFFQQYIVDNMKGYAYRSGSMMFCNKVWDEMINSRYKSIPDTAKDIVQSLDVFNVSGITSECAETESRRQAEKCAFSVLSAISNFEPTGILTMAVAFMKPTCEVTTEVLVPTQTDLEAEEAEKSAQGIDDGCITLYDDCHFRGRSTIICGDRADLKTFSDRTSSFIVGSNFKGLLFEHPNYKGRAFPFGPNQAVKCLDDHELKMGNQIVKFSDFFSSIKKDADDCLSIIFKRKGSPEDSYLICGEPEAVIDEEKYFLQSDRFRLEYMHAYSYSNTHNYAIYGQIRFEGQEYVINKLWEIDVESFFFRYIRSWKRKRIVDPVKDGCIVLYEKCSYEGEFMEVCENKESLYDFSDWASSVRTGKGAHGLFFDLEDYQGQVFQFGENQEIPCLHDVVEDGTRADNIISSIKFKADECVIMKFLPIDKDWDKKIEKDIDSLEKGDHTTVIKVDNIKIKDTTTAKDPPVVKLLCETMSVTDIIIPPSKYLKFRNYNTNIYLTLYTLPKYEGEYLKVTGNFDANPEGLFLNRFQSYKIKSTYFYVNPNCLYLFERCEYEHEVTPICDDMPVFKDPNKIYRAYKIGNSIRPFFYSEENYKGNFQMKQYNDQDWECHPPFKIGSILINNKEDDCFIIGIFEVPSSRTVRCGNQPVIDFNYLSQYEIIKLEIPWPKHITFYEENNYKGKYRTYDGDIFGVDYFYIEKSEYPIQLTKSIKIKSLPETTHCMFLYEKCDFEGLSVPICGETNSLNHLNKKAVSYVKGRHFNGYFYSEENFKGDIVSINRKDRYDCSDNKSLFYDNLDLSSVASYSPRLHNVKEGCLLVRFENQNYELCEQQGDTDITLPENKSNLQLHYNKDGYFITLYEDSNFKGRNEVIFNQESRYVIQNILLKKINSYRIYPLPKNWSPPDHLCIQLYSGCGFTGHSSERCFYNGLDKPILDNMVGGVNSYMADIKSVIFGKGLSGTLYTEEFYQGRSMKFGPGTKMVCIKAPSPRGIKTISLKFG